LKGINYITTAWAEVSVKCLNGDWRKYLPPFMHDFTGFGPVENTADDVRSTTQQARLGKVREEDITWLLDSHEQQLFNKDLQNGLRQR
jgi:hypothetical protein